MNPEHEPNIPIGRKPLDWTPNKYVDCAYCNFFLKRQDYINHVRTLHAFFATTKSAHAPDG